MKIKIFIFKVEELLKINNFFSPASEIFSKFLLETCFLEVGNLEMKVGKFINFSKIFNIKSKTYTDESS